MKIDSTGEQYGNKIIAFGGWDPRGAHSENGYKNYFFDGFAISNFENMNTYCNFYKDAEEDFSWATFDKLGSYHLASLCSVMGEIFCP